MDSVKFLLYVLGRIGVFIAVNLFGAFTARVLFPALSSFVSESSAAGKFLLNSTWGSFAGWLVMLIFLAVLFFDDGKRHAAYEIWNSINITIVLIMMLLVYFVPVIFRDSFNAEGKGKAFYTIVYAPVLWLEQKFGMAHTSAAGLGAGIILFILFWVYVISYKLYLRKHKTFA